MINELENIDRELSFNVNQIHQIADTLIFEEYFRFKMQEDLPDLSIGTLNFPGVYFFEIQNNHGCENISNFLSEFKDKWEFPEYKYCFVPNTIAKRLICHTAPMDWVPLYIGISKNITSRLQSHLYMPMTATTFAMKLLARKNLVGYNIRISAIEINVTNYDLILPKIESFLRNKFNPIIGRQ